MALTAVRAAATPRVVFFNIISSFFEFFCRRPGEASFGDSHALVDELLMA
jgi:hypothetical protein